LLKIRLSRTGKKDQESFRIIVQEHARPVKRKFLEVVGHYRATIEPRTFQADKERIKYWISKGAKPTDSLAALLKKYGFEDMDQYLIKPRDKQRKKKKEAKEEAKAAPAAAAKPAAEKPAEEATPAKAEAPAEAEATAEEKAQEQEAPAPQQEAPKEDQQPEAPAEESKGD
jgi:small subunit ribosomal protein S16